MISTVSLLNDIKQPEFIMQTDREYSGDRFAFSSMLQNVINEDQYSRQTNEVRDTHDTTVQNDTYKGEISEDRDIFSEDYSENDSIEDTEIELTIEEDIQSNAKQSILAMLGNTDTAKGKTDFGDKNKYTAAIAGLNTFVKKNIEITDGRHSAESLLGQQQLGKTAKIKVNQLDSKAKTQVTNILQNIRTGKITESAGMMTIAQIVSDSQAGKALLKDKTNGKNVKITAKAVNAKTGNGQMNTTLLMPQTRMSQTVKAESDNGIKTKTNQNKAQDSVNTEVNRRYDKTKKAKALEQGNTVSNGNQPELKELVTEFSLKTENLHESDNPVDLKKDIKSVLSENKDAIFNKMVENTKTIQSQNMTKFSMVMRPENVGRMDFHLTVKDGKLDGRIILQNSEAADFFRANIEEITAVFRKANVELGKLDVSLAGQQFNSEAQTFAGSQSSGGGQTYSRETLETVQAVSHLSGRAVSAYESHATPAAGSYISNNKVNLLI